jgi:hypothetical protein
MVIRKGINRDAEDVPDYLSQIYDHLWCSTGEATFSAAAIKVSAVYLLVHRGKRNSFSSSEYCSPVVS